MRISVAIPTIAGRQKYLESSLRTCVDQDYADLEIVVSDNSAGEAKAIVEAVSDPRVRYVRPPRYLPMSAHWDFVVSQVQGEVVSILGDDDGLAPKAVSRVAALLRVHGVVPVRSSVCFYYWPDHPQVALRNSFWMPEPASGEVRWISSREFLADLAGGRTQYDRGPTVYHGFVPTAILKGLQADGRIFHRSGPDVYAAVAVAATVERYLFCSEYLSISGAGARSNGGSVAAGGVDARRFWSEVDVAAYRARFNGRSVPLHELDTLLEVAQRLGREELSAAINYPEVLVNATRAAMGLRGWRLRSTELLEVLRIGTEKEVLARYARSLAARVLLKALHRLGRSRVGRVAAEGLSLHVPPQTPRRTLHQDVRNVADAAQALFVGGPYS